MLNMHNDGNQVTIAPVPFDFESGKAYRIKNLCGVSPAAYKTTDEAGGVLITGALESWHPIKPTAPMAYGDAVYINDQHVISNTPAGAYLGILVDTITADEIAAGAGGVVEDKLIAIGHGSRPAA